MAAHRGSREQVSEGAPKERRHRPPLGANLQRAVLWLLYPPGIVGTIE